MSGEEEGLSLKRKNIDSYSEEVKRERLDYIRRVGTLIKKTQKVHRCFNCGNIIPKSSQCLGGGGDWEERLCLECISEDQDIREGIKRIPKHKPKWSEEVELRECNQEQGIEYGDVCTEVSQ